MTARPEKHRARSWGADSPADEDEARRRLLAAADACYADKGPVRTRMSDIARRAGVHRSTVYYYFPTKDALLAASFVRVLAATAEAVERCWQTDDPFMTQLVAACLRGTDIARSSPIMRSLIEEHQALGVAYHAAEGSELWRAKLADTLVRRLEAAAVAGEIRRDLPASTLARWIVRINFSLIAEPASPEDGGDEGLLRNLLVASLTPRA
ncbi:repressor [Mycobacterium intracellulare]|uniref:TetR/AcrR family transcriptional regulator n=1 Tax=Mycobacterium intracellulare TaxID=1767 RepID=UPI0007E963E3|nr:TetR/AcrR family transcriptional regulator [Mycobacterium intracellulare]MEE3753206.1 TetR/AcrR family transcriptional regulator [Mycobacterium intracellulare]OBH61894.1 repressor [Mycobacterium intracellulare]